MTEVKNDRFYATVYHGLLFFAKIHILQADKVNNYHCFIEENMNAIELLLKNPRKEKVPLLSLLEEAFHDYEKLNSEGKLSI